MRRVSISRSRIVLALLSTAFGIPATGHAARVGDEARWTKAGERCVYPVVAGGVRSQTELQSVKTADQTVEAHYADFNDQTAVPRILSGPVEGYVSYRKSGRILWTARRVQIPAGETVLDDGVTLIWCKCGRRVSTELPTLASGEEEIADRMAAVPRYRSRGGPVLLVPESLAANTQTPAPVHESIPPAALPVPFTQPANLPSAPYYPTMRPQQIGYFSGNPGMVPSESPSIVETLPYIAVWMPAEPASGTPSALLSTGPAALIAQLAGRPVVLEVTSIPEPRSAALTLAGVMLLAGRILRRSLRN
jgi:hypothetical protein